jgi:hypothetical protein
MKLLLPVCILLSFSAIAQAQSTTGPATTKGACSPATTGNDNTFVINCDIGKEQGAELIAIMNKILVNQLNPVEVMAKLDEILRSVNPNAPKVTYTFDGSRRVISPDRTSLEVGAATEVFHEMLRLEQTNNWNGLIKLSEAQIMERPEWLTAYVMAGEGYFNLGQRDHALSLLEYAEKTIAGNPEYDPIEAGLRAMLARLQVRQ